MIYKKIFYFKNSTNISLETNDTDLNLQQMNNVYYKRLKRGKIFFEYCDDNKVLMIDPKEIQIIHIEKIDKGE